MSNQKTLSKDALKESADLPTEEVEISEWGGTVTVKTLSAKEIIALFSRYTGDHEKDMLEMVIAGLAEPQLTEEDKAWLGGKNFQALNKITKVFLRLNGLQAGALASARKK